jgi:phosphatidate phosphatase
MEYQEESKDFSWKEFIDIPGFVCTIVIDAILGIVMATMKVDPIHLPPGDPLSDFPYPGRDTVSISAVLGIFFGVGLALIVVGYYLAKQFPDRLNHFNPFSAFWLFLSSAGISFLATEIFKNYVGRPRPDLYGRCGYDTSFEECKALIGDAVDDEFKSWPSGHASISMCACTDFTLFLHRLIRSKQLWASALPSFFIFLALYIGATRIRDYRHHPDDVMAGLFLGFVLAYILWVRSSDQVFASDSRKDEDEGPQP